MNDEHLPIFVYGTLQRGEERSLRWPCEPVRVEWATTRGRIYDLGEYPGLVDGGDMVLGQLWHLADGDLSHALRVLDQIECSGDDGVDVYVRRVVECVVIGGASQRGYAYFLADAGAIGDRPAVGPDARGYCHWRRFAPVEDIPSE